MIYVYLIATNTCNFFKRIFRVYGREEGSEENKRERKRSLFI